MIIVVLDITQFTKV